MNFINLQALRTFLYNIFIFHINFNLKLYKWDTLGKEGFFQILETKEDTHDAFYSTDHLGDVFQFSV